MELLKKGIVIGLGAHDMSKKQIEDFVKQLQTTKIINKDQYSELVNLIMDRKAKVNDHLNARIENFIKTQMKKEELATISHIDYLEKRIDLLEEEVYNLLLEKYIEDVDDKEISELLKDLELNKNVKSTKKDIPEDHFFDSDWLDSEELYDDLVKSENDDLKDLLYLPKEEEGKMFGKKKKVAKAPAKKPAVKKKVVAKKPVKKAAVKKPTVKKVTKKPVKKVAVKKPVAAKKPAVKRKTTKKAKK